MSSVGEDLCRFLQDEHREEDESDEMEITKQREAISLSSSEKALYLLEPLLTRPRLSNSPIVEVRKCARI